MKQNSSRAWTARVAAAFGVIILANAVSTRAEAGVVANGWNATHTDAFPVRKGTLVGALAAATPMHIVVGLKLRDREALDSFIAERAKPGNPLYGSRMTPAQFVARHSPSQAKVDAVVAYLRAYGFTNIEVSENRTLIEADTTAASVRSAFNTELAEYRIGDRSAYANTRPAHVPVELADTVLSVLGLQTVEMVHTMNVAADTRTAASTNATAKGYNPTKFPVVYDAVSIPLDGTSTPVAIISAGKITQSITDLRTFQSQNGLAQTPVNTVYVGRQGISTSGVPEWDLDSQDIVSMAGNSSTSYGVQSLTFYVATSLLDSALTPTYNKVVTDNKAYAINVSLGACESSEYSSGGMAQDDQIFAQAAAQGQTFFVSSGDSGSAECGSGTVTVSYPASSPYVYAVGGTSLYSDSSYNYLSESAWSGGGGGVSQYETAPAWQQQYLGATRRIVPDSAYDADPNTGAIIVVNGRSAQYGGTSLSAPLMTATWARFQSAEGNALGFAPPNVYWAAVNITTPYVPVHDVTTGSNGAYSAAAGFDYTTGFGSIDVDAGLHDFGF